MILAGDIGGTNTRLAIFSRKENLLTVEVEAVFPSREYPNLDTIVDKFRSNHPLEVTQACFGIAGPVKHGRCEATNLPWVVDARILAEQLGLPRVGLMNDLKANAHGIAALQPSDFLTLAHGEVNPEGNMALIAAGTGLGEAGLYADERGNYHPFATEGGHTDFAPSDELQIELLRYLQTKFVEHVSWERVVCGPGIYNIYQFLRDTQRHPEPAWLAAELEHQAPPAVITTTALAGKSALCEATLDLFVTLYGAEAGNLALKCQSTAGLFIGGGIAPRIVEKLQEGAFMRAFLAKGRMRSLLAAMPVRVILNDKTALLGAALAATVY
jgi:glucokinase